MQVGDLVDVAYVPQLNEFRGQRTVQLHLVEIRLCDKHTIGPYEHSHRRLSQGERIPSQEAAEITPVREEFRVLWQWLVKNGWVLYARMENLSKRVRGTGALARTRTFVCLDVLAESGLLHIETPNV